MTDKDLIIMAMTSSEPSSTGWYRVVCPFCLENTGKPDRKGSLAVSASTGNYTCWKCEEKGRVDLGYSGYTPAPEVKKAVVVDAPEGFFPLWEDPGLTAAAFKPARQYLVKRLGKRAKKIAELAGIGACATGYRANRIIVPILDEARTKWVGWVGRDWTDTKKLRYVYPKGMTRVLYNQAILHDEKETPTLVVEGIFDALPYWPNVVACLGKPSKDQVEALKKSKSPLVIALDSDAWKQGWSLAQQLKFLGVECGFVKLPPGEDPGSVDPAWLLEEAGASIMSDR